MHTRDFAALALSLLAIHLSLSHDGPVTLRKAWFHHTPPDTASALEGAPPYIPPPPVAADLNGDGAVEVVVASPDGRLAVLGPRPPLGAAGAGFAPAPVLASAALGPAGPAVPGVEWRAVALASGFLDPPPAAPGVAAPRKRVVVALTANLEVVALDHRLRELWRAPLLLPHADGDRFPVPPPGSVVREAAVLVAPHPLRPGDRGSVFVSAAVRHAAGSGGSGGGGGGGGADAADTAAPDGVTEAVAADAAGGVRGHAPGSGGGAADGGGGGGGGGGATHPAPLHTATHAALAGQSGARRWTASPEAGGAKAPPAAGLRRQHDLRLDAAAVAAARAAADAAGGAACRDHRDGVLSVLPHAWDRPTDTRLRLAHFAHRRAVKEGLGPRARRVADLGRAGPTSAGLARPSAAAGGGQSGNAVVAAAARAAAAAGRGAARAPGARAPPPPPPGASAATLAAWHAAHKPNAVVAHGAAGLEVFHLHSGSRVCGLRAPHPGVTADLDGDGVPDYVTAVSSAGHGGRGGGGDTAHAHPRACEGVALAGVPPTQPLWNVSLCHGHAGGPGSVEAMFGGGGGDDPASAGGALIRGADAMAALLGVEAAPPTLLRLPRWRGGGGGGHTTLVAFLVSSGEVTAVHGADGRLAWRRLVPGAGWRPRTLRAAGAARAAPTLAPVALRPGGPPAALLVGGDRRSSLVSPAGHVLASVDLPGAPLLPLSSPGDLDGDGLADFVVATRDGFYGWSQARRAGGGGGGGLPMSALVGVLVAAMVLVWWTQQAGGRGAAKGGRATDRED